MTLGELRALHEAGAVEEDLERTRRREPRIELAQAAGGRISRVHEDLFTLFLGPAIHLLEAGDGHEDFATYFQQLRMVRPRESQRHGLDRTDVVRDVLADRAVATRGGNFQRAAPVGQADRKAVQLRFAGVLASSCSISSRSRTRRSKATTSSRENALSRDSIGTAMPYLGKRVDR